MVQRKRSSAVRPRRIRLLLVDRQQTFTDVLRFFLAAQPGLAVMGTARNAQEAIRMVKRCPPDLVIASVTKSHQENFDSAKLLLENIPEIKLLGINFSSASRQACALIKAGARGVVPTSSPISELVRAIEVIARGGFFNSSAIASSVKGQGCSIPGIHANGITQLSERQRRVLALIAAGCSNKEMSDLLKLSVRTVEKHREFLVAKLRIRSVAGLTKCAIRNGLASLD